MSTKTTEPQATALGINISSVKSIDMSTLSEEQINTELEKGYADMKAGRTKSAKKVFEDIRRNYDM